MGIYFCLIAVIIHPTAPVAAEEYPPKSKNFANIQKAPQTTIIAVKFREKYSTTREQISFSFAFFNNFMLIRTIIQKH